VRLLQKPTYVNFDKCIGCRLCEYACDAEYPDPFEQGLGAVRAIAVPFTNAIPQKAFSTPSIAARAEVARASAPRTPSNSISSAQSCDSHRRGDRRSGFQLNAITVKTQYNAQRSKNIIAPLTLERLLAPHGPMTRSSSIRWKNSILRRLCAVRRIARREHRRAVLFAVCCMYSIKQAMLLSGSLPLADITIYYMDIRAFGKGYEQFFQNAKAMGISFVRAR